jgi:hypothetical protein
MAMICGMSLARATRKFMATNLAHRKSAQAGSGPTKLHSLEISYSGYRCSSGRMVGKTEAISQQRPCARIISGFLVTGRRGIADRFRYSVLPGIDQHRH